MDKPLPIFTNEFVTVKVIALTLKVARQRMMGASAQLAALRAKPRNRRELVRYAERVVLAWHDRVWELQQHEPVSRRRHTGKR